MLAAKPQTPLAVGKREEGPFLSAYGMDLVVHGGAAGLKRARQLSSVSSSSATERVSLPQVREFVKQAAEVAGIKVPTVWASPRIPWRATSHVTGLLSPFITVNSSSLGIIDLRAWRFVAAHEVGHICFSTDTPSEAKERLGFSHSQLINLISVNPKRIEYASDWFAMQIVGRDLVLASLQAPAFGEESLNETSSDYRSHPYGHERILNLQRSNATYLHFPPISTDALKLLGGRRGVLMAQGVDITNFKFSTDPWTYLPLAVPFFVVALFSACQWFGQRRQPSTHTYR